MPLQKQLLVFAAILWAAYLLAPTFAKDDEKKKDCDKNQHWGCTSSTCIENCSNTKYFPDLLCTGDCLLQCICNDGYVYKNGTSGECIKKSECAEPCGKNAEVSDCVPDCEVNCHTYKDSETCANTTKCVTGCRCKPGYIFKEGRSGDCIPRSQCKCYLIKHPMPKPIGPLPQ